MFLLDSNVFMNASRLYYAPDIAPTFWEWLGNEHEKGNVASIVRVREEIDDGEAGHLTTWAASLPRTFWIKPGADTFPSLSQLSTWTMDPARQYSRAARDQFLRVADYYLVAQAHAADHTVVTFEKAEPHAKKRVAIPDVCMAMGVAYSEPFGIYRRLGLRFAQRSLELRWATYLTTCRLDVMTEPFLAGRLSPQHHGCRSASSSRWRAQYGSRGTNTCPPAAGTNPPDTSGRSWRRR